MSTDYSKISAFLLTTTLSGISLPAAADEPGVFFDFGYGFPEERAYSFSLPYNVLEDRYPDFDPNILPNNFSFILANENSIRLGAGWRSDEIHRGPFILTYGSSLNLTYSSNASFNASVNDQFLANTERLLRDAANQAIIDLDLDITTEQAVEAAIAITSLVINNPDGETINPSDIEDILPDGISPVDAAIIINEALPLIEERRDDISQQDVDDALEQLGAISFDLSQAGHSARIHFDNFARIALDTYPISPYIQGNLGYQVVGFASSDFEEGFYFHGPTASVQIGVTGEFNDRSWDAYIAQPFSFEQTSAYDVTVTSSDDPFIGGRFSRHFNASLINSMSYDFQYIPETENSQLLVNLRF
ncbi:MAG: hypothetical protein AAF549_04990 [Pseudomonadota bacterium]